MTYFQRSLIETTILATHTEHDLKNLGSNSQTRLGAFYYKRLCEQELLLLEMIKPYSKKKDLTFALLTNSKDLAKIDEQIAVQIEWIRRLTHWAKSHTTKNGVRVPYSIK